MGSWSYLAVNRSSNPDTFINWFFEYDDIQIIMAAKYVLPPLWHSLFQESDLHMAAPIVDGEEIPPHPVYITPAEIGIQRATRRRARFCGLFQENIEPVYDKWLELLQLFKGNYIHMDWSEVANMGNPEDMNQRVRAGVRAFDSDAVEDWTSCFGTNTLFEPKTKQATLDPYTQQSPNLIEADLFGYHFVRKTGAAGKPEWVAEP